MPVSNCCFLTWIQVSQDAGKVAWYSHLLKNFPQFVVIHTVKGFSVVNEAEVDVFLEFLGFFYQPTDVGNLFFCTFLNSACTSGSSQFISRWSLPWRILNITLLPSSFRIWNNSRNSITSTSFAHSDASKGPLYFVLQVSGSRWVITPIVVIRVIKTFSVEFICVFLPPLLNLFCFSRVLAISAPTILGHSISSEWLQYPNHY